MRNIFSILVILLILGFTSCKKDKGGDPAICSGAWAEQVMDEVDAMLEAYTAYLEDPSNDNCIAYRDALQDYVDALEPYLECSAWTTAEREELQEELENSEDEISTLCTD